MTNNNSKTIKKWHLVDLKGKILGREGTYIASLLMGKSKPEYVRNLDLGDYVVVINALQVKLTGNKETKKNYYHHTGYPDGMRIESFAQVKAKDPRRIISHAVAGMLPQNKLKPLMLKRLYIYTDDKHPFSDKFV